MLALSLAISAPSAFCAAPPSSGRCVGTGEAWRYRRHSRNLSSAASSLPALKAAFAAFFVGQNGLPSRSSSRRTGADADAAAITSPEPDLAARIDASSAD